MVRADNEKMLGANLPVEFVDNFWIHAAPGKTPKGLVIETMAKLWLSLPEAVRKELLFPEKTHEKEPALESVLEKIVDKKLDEYFAKQKKKAKS